MTERAGAVTGMPRCCGRSQQRTARSTAVDPQPRPATGSGGRTTVTSTPSPGALTRPHKHRGRSMAHERVASPHASTAASSIAPGDRHRDGRRGRRPGGRRCSSCRSPGATRSILALRRQRAAAPRLSEPNCRSAIHATAALPTERHPVQRAKSRPARRRSGPHKHAGRCLCAGGLQDERRVCCALYRVFASAIDA